jgi:hypothetical protein
VFEEYTVPASVDQPAFLIGFSCYSLVLTVTTQKDSVLEAVPKLLL